jgi:hypothetical protein
MRKLLKTFLFNLIKEIIILTLAIFSLIIFLYYLYPNLCFNSIIDQNINTLEEVTKNPWDIKYISCYLLIILLSGNCGYQYHTIMTLENNYNYLFEFTQSLQLNNYDLIQHNHWLLNHTNFLNTNVYWLKYIIRITVEHANELNNIITNLTNR